MEKEQTLTTNIIYQGKIINLSVDEVILPNQKLAKREVVYHPGGVGILAIKNDEVYMVEQFRYPYQEFIYEIPAGKLEANETPYQTGIRELQEETGLIAKTLHSLGKIYPSPGYTNEVIHLYYTNDFLVDTSCLDEDEFLEVKKLKLDSVYKLIAEGKIVDAKTIIALLKYKQLRREEEI